MHRTVKSKVNHGGRILFNCDFVDEEKKNISIMEEFFQKIQKYPADERCDENGVNYKELFIDYFSNKQMGDIVLLKDVDINIELMYDLVINKKWKELHLEIMNDYNKLVAYYEKVNRPDKINFLK